jgi:hypothetical protein
MISLAVILDRVECQTSIAGAAPRSPPWCTALSSTVTRDCRFSLTALAQLEE